MIIEDQNPPKVRKNQLHELLSIKVACMNELPAASCPSETLKMDLIRGYGHLNRELFVGIPTRNDQILFSYSNVKLIFISYTCLAPKVPL